MGSHFPAITLHIKGVIFGGHLGHLGRQIFSQNLIVVSDYLCELVLSFFICTVSLFFPTTWKLALICSVLAPGPSQSHRWCLLVWVKPKSQRSTIWGGASSEKYGWELNSRAGGPGSMPDKTLVLGSTTWDITLLETLCPWMSNFTSWSPVSYTTGKNNIDLIWLLEGLLN